MTMAGAYTINYTLLYLAEKRDQSSQILQIPTVLPVHQIFGGTQEVLQTEVTAVIIIYRLVGSGSLQIGSCAGITDVPSPCPPPAACSFYEKTGVLY